jgi:HPt (histidine-containing phosphotransfer) domain-containing protein
MAQRAIETSDPAMVPAIDRGHLARMTFGDRGLEHEVLELFDRQAALLIERMRKVDGLGDGAVVGALAHTLKGSAAGIGASRVASAAQGVELAASSSAGDVSRALDRLAAAVAEAQALIAELLRAP